MEVRKGVLRSFQDLLTELASGQQHRSRAHPQSILSINSIFTFFYVEEGPSREHVDVESSRWDLASAQGVCDREEQGR